MHFYSKLNRYILLSGFGKHLETFHSTVFQNIIRFARSVNYLEVCYHGFTMTVI